MRFDLGGCNVRLVSGGGLKLDGGAMFGIIPKPLWARSTPADENNRIQLACNCLLVEFTGGQSRRLVVETGHGQKYSAKEQGLFAIEPQRWLLAELSELGVPEDSIDDVVVTHLHFDHAGGLTCRSEAGLLPSFSRARVHVQKREFDDARANFGIMTATYREENFTPVDAAEAWRLADGETEILPGVRVIPSPGHTRGHQSVLIRGRDRSMLFLGDVMPTRNHAGAPYNMGYDLLPLENRETKRSLLQAAAEQEWLVVIDHDPEVPVVRVARDGDWFSLVAAPGDGA